MIASLLLCLAPTSTQEPTVATREPARLDAVEIEAIDQALERAAAWLRAHQSDDGAFKPKVNAQACPIALTAIALWASMEDGPAMLEPAAASSSASFLASHRQQDGGIHDPRRGLAVYTTGVASRALRAIEARGVAVELQGDAAWSIVVGEAELYVHRAQHPESLVDLERRAAPIGDVSVTARRALQATDEATPEQRKALDFLARCAPSSARPPVRMRPPRSEADASDLGGFDYDDLLPYVYLEVAPEHQVAQRAFAALRSLYVVDRNPDLTQRYGGAGFQSGDAGLFYYYLVAAKTLHVHRVRRLERADGAAHDWVRELSQRLIRLQAPDGSWSNSDPRWWESEPVLATGYAVLALKHCRAMAREVAGG